MSDGLSGNLAQLPLRDLLRMLGATEQTGRIEFALGNERCEVFLRRGAVCHATADAATGEAAFTHVMGWTSGAFRFEPGLEAFEVTISKPLDQLFSDGARQVSEREQLRKAIPSPDAVPHLAPRINAENVTISAADWEVLARLGERLSVAELARALGKSDLEMVRTLYRLKQMELIEVSVEHAAPVQISMAGPSFFVALQAAVAAAMGPLAEIIVDDTLEALGFTRTTLPRSAMSSVTERIGQEIRDTAKRVRFQQTMLETLRQQAA